MNHTPITSWVYCIGERSGTLVKFGKAENPKKRLKELQTGNGRELYLIAAVPGAEPEEAALRFAWGHLHERGEWHLDDGQQISNFFIARERSINNILAKGELPIEAARVKGRGRAWLAELDADERKKRAEAAHDKCKSERDKLTAQQTAEREERVADVLAAHVAATPPVTQPIALEHRTDNNSPRPRNPVMSEGDWATFQELICQDMSEKQACERIGLTVSDVKTYRQRFTVEGAKIWFDTLPSDTAARVAAHLGRYGIGWTRVEGGEYGGVA